MDLHGNAALSWSGRRELACRVVDHGWTVTAAAEAAGVSVRTLSKWLRRFREEGEQGLLDRSSSPRSVPNRTSEERVAVIALLRRLRMTGAEVAETLRMPHSTVSAVLRRIGLGKLSRLEPPEPPNRYERRIRASSCISTSTSSGGSKMDLASASSGMESDAPKTTREATMARASAA